MSLAVRGRPRALRAETPSKPATEQCAIPREGPLGVRMTTAPPAPHPGSARSGARGAAESIGRPRAPGGFQSPSTQQEQPNARKQARAQTGGGGENRPAGHRSDLACACGHGAGVARWGAAGGASSEQRGAPPRGVLARSHAPAGRRVGLEAQPERQLPARGAKYSHAVKREESAGSPGRIDGPHGGGRGWMLEETSSSRSGM